MDEGYLRPELFLFSTAIGVLTSLLINVATRPTETEGRYTMEPREIVGRSRDEFAAALDLMESTMDLGQKARITICTKGMPTEEELDYMFLGMVETGCHISRPSAQIIQGIPTTEFVLQKGSPQWQIIIPILVPLFTIGLIAWGIVKIETIAKALIPLMLIGFGGLIILAVVLRKPAEKYIERGGTRLPATSKKSLAVR